jgi:hypothetical protein
VRDPEAALPSVIRSEVFRKTRIKEGEVGALPATPNIGGFVNRCLADESSL